MSNISAEENLTLYCLSNTQLVKKKLAALQVHEEG